ncbi:hypothetical protein REPUB_Repub14bG0156700 [Reevesia pubescens]
MMSRIPARLNRIAVAFNEAAAKAPMRLCQSSGSEHSPEDFADLSDLVNSFLERGCEVETDEGKIDQEDEEEEQDDHDGYWSEIETKRELLSLLSNAHDDNQEELDLKQKIGKETELACEMILGDWSSEDFKRQLMSHLRDKGFDAGLCKSRWEKLGRHLPAGKYEYVDVKINGTRYIIEANLEGEFEIARPTTSYASLLEVIPPIFVGKPKVLKQIVRLMCKAMKASMKSRAMHTPPWRRSGYMKSKWLASYRRTVNEIPAQNASQFNDSVSARSKRLVGFEAIPTTISFGCRDNSACKAGLKVGYLAAAFNGTSQVEQF